MSATAAAGLAGVVAGLLLGGGPGLLAGLAGVALLLWAAYSPGDGLLLLGPFARRELVRAARRPRLFAWRVVVVALATALVASAVGRLSGRRPSLGEMATAAENGFAAVAGLTFALAVAVTLAQMPGVIAEERERNRLDHLLVTDLRSREIILGKVVGRLAVLLGYVLATLPVLALLTWLGGVDPRHVAAFGVLAVGTVAGLTGIAVFCSAVRRTITDAVVMSITLSLAGLVLTAACYGVGRFAERKGYAAADVLMVAATLNPFVAADRADVSRDPDAFDRLVWPVLRQFAAGQLVLFAAGWAVAARNLRLAVAPPDKPADVRKRGREATPLARPPVTDDPVYWYETTTHTSYRKGVLRGCTTVALVLVILVGVAAVAFVLTLRGGTGLARVMAEMTGGLAFFAVTLPTAWLASRSTVRERERDTLDALRLSPLEPQEVLRQKMAAAMRSTRGPLLVIVAVWSTLTGCGVLPLSAFAGFATTAVACWVLAASAGVRSSVTATTQNQSFLRLGFWAGMWFLVVLTAGLITRMAGGLMAAQEAVMVTGMPVVAQIVAAGRIDNGFYNTDVSGRTRMLAACLASVAVAAVMSAVFYRQAVWKFAAEYRPTPDKEPGG